MAEKANITVIIKRVDVVGSLIFIIPPPVYKLGKIDWDWTRPGIFTL
jgi:hypothetical protein